MFNRKAKQEDRPDGVRDDDASYERHVERGDDIPDGEAGEHGPNHTHGEHARDIESSPPSDAELRGEEAQRAEFGGLSGASVFFGWLVSVGLVIVVGGIIVGVVAAVGEANDVTRADVDDRAGTVGIIGAAVGLVVLMIGYYLGGYVAGRMARFNGVKQGVGLWVLGTAVSIIAGVAGGVLGREYDAIDRSDISISTDDLTLGGVITVVAVLLGTLLAAMAGGRVGTRFHRKVDRVW